MDELKETNVNMNDKISTKIDKVDSLVYDLLIKVEVQPISYHSANKGRFPSWVVRSDKKLLQTNAPHIFDIVVATDGTGDFTTVMEAVHVAPSSSEKRYVIFIKRGVYVENVEVEFDKKNLMMIGEGMDATIISSNLSHKKINLSTYFTATFGVMGGGFIARDMSFRNTAGPMGEQAVALKSLSDFSVFYRCGIFCYQDSLYAHSNRQFYRDCKISGTMDFIFGYAIAVFQNCKLLVKNGLPKQSNTITAQGGKVNGDLTGFSFQFCNISADFDLLPFVKSTSTFFGRPWQSYSTTIFMRYYLSDVLSPKGWLGWNKSQYLDTLYYAEYKNYGPGAKIQGRVKWKRYHILNDYRQANNFTAAHFILGNLWLSSTGVPFTLGFGSHT